jgi:hypothetical protein
MMVRRWLAQLSVISLLLCGGLVLAPTTITAQGIDPGDKTQACTGVSDQACTGDDTNDFQKIWESVLNIVSYVVGAISVLMILIGGLRYVLSNGDANAISAAKNTILYALVGLIIAFIARGLVFFVINRI